MITVEQLTPAITHHGEGPVWDLAADALKFVDLLRGDVLTLSQQGQHRRQHVAPIAAAVRPRRDGGLIVAVERGFALLDAADQLQMLPELWADPAIRMNDGGCDTQGRFYCGTMAYDQTPNAGALYRLEPDGTTQQTLTSVTISNGIAWSASGETVYYVDSPTRRVDLFDYETSTGTFSDRRPYLFIDEGDAVPDGITLDAEGGLWVALWGAGRVHRYGPTGELDAVITVPATLTTACTFGGPGLQHLYITTSRHGLAVPSERDGALFYANPGVRGLLPFSFAG